MTDFPALAPEFIDYPTLDRLEPISFDHPPRFLLLYGSLRERSFSRLLVEEADRLLRSFGAETRIFDPRGLPQPDDADPSHPKVQELREASIWSEGHVWCSPERHGAMTGIFKSQIDWLPLESGGVRPTQGRTLAVMQVNAGSQSFNTVNQLRVLGRWMRMLTIPKASATRVEALEAAVNTPGTGLAARITTAEQAIATEATARAEAVSQLLARQNINRNLLPGGSGERGVVGWDAPAGLTVVDTLTRVVRAVFNQEPQR